MAKTLTLVIAYSDFPGYPAGTVVTGIKVDVAAVGPGPSPLSQTVPPNTGAVSFADMGVGSYTYTISAVDFSGAVLGTPVTGSFDVTFAQTVTISLPVSAQASVN
jgi:hypothetical protein